jgi:hypothetical protein
LAQNFAPSRFSWPHAEHFIRELLRDLLGADRGADLEEQAVRLPELSLPRRFVAGQSGELGALDVEEGLVALRARHFEPGVGFGERGLDLSRRLKAPGLAESADSGVEPRTPTVGSRAAW